MYRQQEAHTHGSAFTQSALLSLSFSSLVTVAINSGRDLVVFLERTLLSKIKQTQGDEGLQRLASRDLIGVPEFKVIGQASSARHREEDLRIKQRQTEEQQEQADL
ncbi:hypothetical protein ACLB2K_020519 [Fragaria x ananassa]